MFGLKYLPWFSPTFSFRGTQKSNHLSRFKAFAQMLPQGRTVIFAIHMLVASRVYLKANAEAYTPQSDPLGCFCTGTTSTLMQSEVVRYL